MFIKIKSPETVQTCIFEVTDGLSVSAFAEAMKKMRKEARAIMKVDIVTVEQIKPPFKK